MIDQRHLMILGQLRSAARLPLTVISKATGIPSSSVFDLHQKMLKRKILRHVSHLDYRAIGYPYRKRFHFSIKDRLKARNELLQNPFVNTLTRVGRSDLQAEAIFKDLNEVEEFKTALQGVKATRVKEFDIIEELKHETFIPR